mmetsp:Transcript_62407/g.135244  ORF Transcript_62407/g.135244 Transcript_62407/m.135244 type:complete len:85 (+) Transcript_62407:908-1162(+)|eukprot:CAMPEP_0116898908 /NCGR_PEP_ID=MMETSP0467-20121206/7559_1 /TAXON_ID=283647 /ORGANISM="Mesodinium pulex, Strain SPMC105" /LENGTH=84 /DNA_ID=CAMNT_0004571363 /DNA_START=908 /DNA_END=1162 /DNA_ORIENTATION=-
MLRGEHLTAEDREAFETLDQVVNVNFEAELEAIKDILKTKEPENQLVPYEQQVEELGQLVQWDIDTNALMEWLLKWQYSDQDAG